MSSTTDEVTELRSPRGLAAEFATPGVDADTGEVVLRSRWTRLLAWPWLLAAALWTIAVVTHATATGALPLDILAVPLLVFVAGALRRVRAIVDADAVTLHSAWSTQRVLWAAVAKLEVDRHTRLEPALHLWRRGDDRPIAITATWNAPREELDRFLAAAAAPIAAHGVTVEEHGP